MDDGAPICVQFLHEELQNLVHVLVDLAQECRIVEKGRGRGQPAVEAVQEPALGIVRGSQVLQPPGEACVAVAGLCHGLDELGVVVDGSRLEAHTDLLGRLLGVGALRRPGRAQRHDLRLLGVPRCRNLLDHGDEGFEVRDRSLRGVIHVPRCTHALLHLSDHLSRQLSALHVAEVASVLQGAHTKPSAEVYVHADTAVDPGPVDLAATSARCEVLPLEDPVHGLDTLLLGIDQRQRRLAQVRPACRAGPSKLGVPLQVPGKERVKGCGHHGSRHFGSVAHGQACSAAKGEALPPPPEELGHPRCEPPGNPARPIQGREVRIAFEKGGTAYGHLL
mmetsp:Transcript_53452/g.114944  ORF Transcript_53452/g.114944 Transcript_53452/m.114944 type:complete len:335 (-) Transcript_53452:1480-2484(-)